MNSVLHAAGRLMARSLLAPRPGFVSAVSGGDEASWRRWVVPGDVLLIEGHTRVSSAIKYLTQSTWSHACLVVGERCPAGPLIEAVMDQGVIASPFAKYENYNVRICRPIKLTTAETDMVVQTAIGQLGHQYDLRNLFDLARFFVPLPFPAQRRRRMLTFGSGEPTRAICSSLIAQAFESVNYPILPIPWLLHAQDPAHAEIVYQVRHYGAYTPRDFDLSPYFDVVKPTSRAGFDFHAMRWV